MDPRLDEIIKNHRGNENIRHSSQLKPGRACPPLHVTAGQDGAKCPSNPDLIEFKGV